MGSSNEPNIPASVNITPEMRYAVEFFMNDPMGARRPVDLYRYAVQFGEEKKFGADAGRWCYRAMLRLVEAGLAVRDRRGLYRLKASVWRSGPPAGSSIVQVRCSACTGRGCERCGNTGLYAFRQDDHGMVPAKPATTERTGASPGFGGGGGKE